MGYRLCMMVDFQNALISRIIRVFSSGFCTEQLLMIFTMDFDIFYGIFSFEPK